MNRLRSAVVLILLWGVGLTAAAAEPIIQVKEDRLTLRVDALPLYGVLEAIGAQARIRLSLMGERPSDGALVSEHLIDQPLAESVEYLLEHYLDRPNYTLVIDPDGGHVVSVHIVAEAFGEYAGASLDTDVVYEGEDDQGQPLDEGLAADEAGIDIDPLDRSIDAAFAAGDVDEQVSTLRALGNYEDPRTLEVLQPALLSERPEVRRAALEALPRAGARAPGLLDDVRSLAGEDPEPAVRQAALMVLIRRDQASVETRELVEALLGEEKVANRDYFQRALERLDEEALARSLPDTQAQ